MTSYSLFPGYELYTSLLMTYSSSESYVIQRNISDSFSNATHPSYEATIRRCFKF